MYEYYSLESTVVAVSGYGSTRLLASTGTYTGSITTVQGRTVFFARCGSRTAHRRKALAPRFPEMYHTRRKFLVVDGKFGQRTGKVLF